MELRTLRSFLAVYEEGHFGPAAGRLHIAQSALSHQVQQLEGELGVRLFDRTTRRVAPTEAGHRLAGQARSMLALAERATEDMRSLSTGHLGRVVVGFVGSATYDVLPRLARQVGLQAPGIELDVRGELLNPELLSAVALGTVDIALVRPPKVLSQELAFQTLRTETLVALLSANHTLSSSPTIRLAELANEPFIIHPSGEQSSMYDVVMAACQTAGFEPRSIREVRETATLAVLVAAGMGVALAPAPVRSLGVEGVVHVPLNEPIPVDLVLVSRAGERSAAVLRVMHILRDLVAD